MKKIKILGLLAMSAVLLTGCLDSMPDMTAEQSDMVSEYAAGLLLKYSPNYDYRLVSDKELAAALAQENVLEEEKTADAVTEQEVSEEKTQEQPNVQESTESAQQQIEQDFTDADMDLAMELGIDDGISLRYQSFEICDSYPKNAAGFSGIDAREGRKLMVMHFDIENSSSENVDCNLYDYSLRIRANINQSISAGAQETPMLLDDMTSFIGSIEAGKKTDVVAVAEITDLADADIETLTIQISSTNGNCNVKVR